MQARYSFGSLVHGSKAWLCCPCSPAPLLPSTESVLPCSLSSAGSCNSAVGLLREEGRAMTVLALISICLGKEPDSSVELRGEHILVWSTGRRLEEIMTLCSCTNAQLKLQGSCRALPLVVVLGQDSYQGKSLGRKGNSFT